MESAESKEINKNESKFILLFESNNPAIGYNQCPNWPLNLFYLNQFSSNTDRNFHRGRTINRQTQRRMH